MIASAVVLFSATASAEEVVIRCSDNVQRGTLKLSNPPTMNCDDFNLVKGYVGSGISVAGISTFTGQINAGSGISVAGLIRTGTGLSVEGTAYISGALTLGVALTTTSGGTGLNSIGSGNQVLGVNNGATGLEYKTIAAGSGISINHTSGQIEIVALSGGSGTVNSGIGGSIAYYAVNGTAVSGTPNLFYSDVYIGILSNSNSTSSTTGALRVVGGLGVSGT